MQIIRTGDLELRFLQSGDTTGGCIDMFEMLLHPKGHMPLPHHHETWEETVYGLSGRSTWTVAGEAIDLLPGQSIFIRRGVVHGFINNTEAPAKCLCVLTPGMLGPRYFEEIGALLAHGAPDRQKLKETMLRYGLVPAPAPNAPDS